jgi:hypothetical protein
MAHIFPTLDRTKHSKLMAYPIGTEALSRALDGAPQHAMMTCDFFAGNPHHEENNSILAGKHVMKVCDFRCK